MKNTAYLAILFFLVCSCKPKSSTHNKAEEHMHHSSFNELVQRFEDPERADWQKIDAVFKFMKLEENDVVGDIGAGTGYFSFPLSKKCSKVIAIDIDPQFVAYLENQKKDREIENIEIRLSEADEPNFNELECDKIIIVNTVHHLDKVAKYLSKVRSCLRIGGSLIIVDFKEGNLPVGPPAEIKIALNQLKQDLALAGFSKLEVDETTLSYQYMIKAN